MDPQNTPLRLLAKTYANDLITREQYIEIRALLLKRLESSGSIDHGDLKNFTTMTQGPEPTEPARRYTKSDWLIISLGLAASAVLAYVIYA